MPSEPQGQSTADALSLGPTLGKVGPYKILKLLGQGGMAAVYQARDERDGSECAVKILARMRPTWVQRFAREFESARKVNHPNVVRVLEAGDEEGLAYFSMEQVEGVTASRYVLELGPEDPLPPAPADRTNPSPTPIDPGILRRSLSVAVQLASAVGAIHGVGLVHRDLKPGNVLVNGSGTVKLVDFGVAKWLQEQSSFTQEGHVVGSYSYMSPEQITGGQVDHRADQYGMGILLYELLSGAPPFRARRPQEYLWLHCTEQPQPLSRRLDGVPSSLDRLLLRMLAKEPADRPPSMAAVERELREIQSTVEQSTTGSHPELLLEVTDLNQGPEEETTRRQGRGDLGRLHRSFKKQHQELNATSNLVADGAEEQDATEPWPQPSSSDDDSTEKVLIDVSRSSPKRPSAPSAASLAALVTPRYTGRKDELDEIMRHLKATRRKGIRAVLLEGEAGIGKTRLLQTFRGLAWVKGARVAIGRCHGSGGAFCAPFHDILLRLAGPGLSRSHNDRILADDRDILQRYFPALTPTDQGPSAAPLGGRQEVEDNRGQLFKAVCGAMRRAASEAPLVIGLEDVQWSDPGTIELVNTMLLRLTPPKAAQILLVLTYRGEDVVAQPSRPLLVPTIEALNNVYSLTLKPLGQEDMEEVIRSVTVNVPVGPNTISQLARAARGNPRFAVEVARSLVVTGGSPASDWKLPTSLLDAYRHRLDSLDKTSRDVSRCIALLGGMPPLPIIHRASSLDEEEFTEAINVLEQRKVIDVDHRGDEDRVQLRSEALRTVVLDSLSGSQAKALHRRAAAAWLKARGPRAESSGQAARHLYAAGEHRAAFPHALEAAYHAGEALDYAAVRRWMAQIGDPGSALQEVSPNAVYRFQMLRFLLLFGDGELEGAQEAVSKAADAATDLRSQLLTGVACARIHIRTGNYLAAVQVCRRGLREARKSELPDLGITFANLGARAARRSGDNQSALSWLAEADILITTRAELKGLAPELAWSRSAVLLELHQEDEAEIEIHRAIHLAQRERQERTLAGLRMTLGRLLTRRGEIPEASSEFQESRKILAEMGEYEMVAENDVNLARLELMQGRVQEATELARSAWSTFHRLHDRRGVIVSGAALLTVARAAQDEPDADAVLQEWNNAIGRGAGAVGAEHWVARARWHRSRDQHDEARRNLEHAESALGASPPRYRKHEVALLQAEVAYHDESYETARDLSQSIAAEAREARHWPMMWMAEAVRPAARAALGEAAHPPEPPQNLMDNDVPLAFHCAWYSVATLLSLGDIEEATEALTEARESALSTGFVDWTNRFVARTEQLESS
ncbi:MAG: hypothetical protein CMP23_02255 [Rickettsiales bacterium]|nr:hypothetical protein [Rickettsiales bacterium]